MSTYDIFGASTIAAPAPEGSSGHNMRRIDIADELGCEEIELEGRILSDDDWKALGEGLATNMTVIAVDIDDSNLNSEVLVHITKSLYSNTSLERLYLNGCQIGEEGAMALGQAIKHNQALVELHMRFACIGGDVGVHSIATAIASNGVLEVLDLGGCMGVGDESAHHLAQALRHNMSLQWMDLSYTGISNKGITALATALGTHNRTLLTLRVGKGLECPDNGEPIDDVSATALAQALGSNTTLLNLKLTGTTIGCAGATRLAGALATNCSLRKLRLHGANVRDDGATALADTLRHNHNLQTLGLSVNFVGDSGATQLAEALACNQTLLKLYLEGNQMGCAGAVQLSMACDRNRSLLRLSLWDTGAKETTINGIERKLRANQLARQCRREWLRAFLGHTDIKHTNTTNNHNTSGHDFDQQLCAWMLRHPAPLRHKLSGVLVRYLDVDTSVRTGWPAPKQAHVIR